MSRYLSFDTLFLNIRPLIWVTKVTSESSKILTEELNFLFHRKRVITKNQIGIGMKTTSSAKMHTNSFWLREFKTIVICLIFYNIQMDLELPFYDLYVFGPIRYTTSSTNRDLPAPFLIQLLMSLIITINKVSDRMQPCGTPISWS